MIKIVQFGQGNFLRTFVDAYFDTLNKEGLGPYRVDIIKPIPFGDLKDFEKQNNKYHIILRGMNNGKVVEDVFAIDSLDSVFSPFEEYDRYLSLATNKDLKIIISNTTEAGITFNAQDDINDFEHMTYPGKLTKFLYHRFKNNLPGVYLLPVELIDNNADELSKCVNAYINLWQLSDDFKTWNQKENHYCNTLVDRIVSGYPRDEKTKKHLEQLVGSEDKILSVGEPFGLWVIENKGNLSQYILSGHHNIDVLLTDDIKYYKKRKVRVLNGSHTNLVPISLWMGKETVYDVMKDPKLSKFVLDTLEEDIIPFVSDDINKTKEFASSVKDRFLNPFLNHQLTSIALNSISKWKARDLPSFLDYYQKNGVPPKYLTIGFAYLVNMYQKIYKNGDLYFVDLPSRTIEVKDDLIYLEYFKSHNVHDFLKDASIWGMDLTTICGFEEQINQYLLLLNNKKDLLA